MQKTKMIFTIGPASDNEETLRKFIEIIDLKIIKYA